MHDHQGAIAALLIALGLVAWYAACERRDRIRAEDERDLYEDELTRAHEGDTQLARLREQRERHGHSAGATLELFTSPVLEVPHQRGPVA